MGAPALLLKPGRGGGSSSSVFLTVLLLAPHLFLLPDCAGMEERGRDLQHLFLESSVLSFSLASQLLSEVKVSQYGPVRHTSKNVLTVPAGPLMGLRQKAQAGAPVAI